jgi:hypothetical protein
MPDPNPQPQISEKPRSEEQNLIDQIEEEDSSSAEESVRPWDPGKIRITTKSFSLRDVVTQITDKEIDLAPDFQRDFVWRERQRTRLIESILLGIRLPAFYFSQDNDGTYQVVDGVQRLSTISSFMNNHHVLSKIDLEYLNQLDGLTYTELPPPQHPDASAALKSLSMSLSLKLQMKLSMTYSVA